MQIESRFLSRPKEHLLSLAEACQVLGLSKRSLRAMCCKGEIEYVKQNNQYFFSVGYLRRYVQGTLE